MCIFRLDLGDDCADLVRQLDLIKAEGGTVQNTEQVLAQNRNRLNLGQRVKFFHRAANLVHDLDLFADCLVGDGGLKVGFQLFLELDNLLGPQLQALGALGVWQLHSVHWLELTEVFVHLLLAVAGGLADNQVGEVEVRAFVGLGKAVAGFDQRAEVARQVLFRVRDGFIRGGAQAYDAGSHRHRNLLREVGAEGADEGNVFLLQLVGSHEGFLTHLAEFAENFGKVFF